ncbi:MAG: hypothetical protein AB7E84_08710 [Xanthobacteraceae bacterium]
MLALVRSIFSLIVDLVRPRAMLEAELLVLRQQIIVLRRGRSFRPTFKAADRLLLDWLCHLFPSVRSALTIVRPETVVRWHRAGFRSYWSWESRRRVGRPTLPVDIRQLIQEMSVANPLWGAPRIHGELLKLGIDVGQTSVAKFMARTRGPPSQGWKAFLLNHADGIAAMDLFVLPTVDVLGEPIRLRLLCHAALASRFEQIPRIAEHCALGLLIIALRGMSRP